MSLKGLRVLGSAAICLASVSLLAPPAAQASFTNCDNPRLQRFGSVVVKGTGGFQIEGASADMRYRYGNICTIGDPNPGGNFSTAWTMASSPDTTQYAQSGIMYQYGDSCWRHFAEQSRPGQPLNPDRRLLGCVANGETHRVWQQVVNLLAPGCCAWRIRSNIDSTIVIQSTFDPLAVWGTPFNAEFAGETTHNSSDIPGYKIAGYPPPTAFTFISVQSLNDDNWYSSCGRTSMTKVTTSPRYSSSILGCDSTESWTSG